MNANELSQIIRSALDEDMPHGDLTTDALKLEQHRGRALLVAKEDLVLSGLEVFAAVFTQLDPEMHLNWQFKDSDFIFKGQTLCILKGQLVALLKGERVALNFMGRLTGIATLTRCFVDQTRNTKTKILDTRKTTPGLRGLEKLAVTHGGGQNHRLNLSTGVLVKENHIRAAGGLEQALTLLRAEGQKNIEVEVRNLEEVKEALRLNVQHLLLDNMNNEALEEVLKIIPGSVVTEVSGNMHIERIAHVAALGVDYISVGALTHSAPCADLSLLFDEI